MNAPCLFQVHAGSYWDQAEFCEEDAEPDSDYCHLHNPDRYEPDWDSIRKDRLYG